MKWTLKYIIILQITKYSQHILCNKNRFQPEKEFEGTDRNQRREGPVQFQKDVEEDPFGLNKFLTEAKKGKRQAEDDSRCVKTLLHYLVNITLFICVQGKKQEISPLITTSPLTILLIKMCIWLYSLQWINDAFIIFIKF